MLSREERGLVTSALKRRIAALYEPERGRQLIAETFGGNPYIGDYTSKMAAKRAIRGRGSYVRDYGERVGSQVGGMFGNRHIGGAIGRSMAGAAARMITGRGAYVLKGSNHMENSAFQASEENMISELEPDVDGIHVIRSEYVGEINPSSSDFTTLLTEDINPLNANIFPWLSQIAQFYREYEFISCIFEFVSTVTGGDNVATGSTIMSGLTPNQDAFSSAVSMEDFYSSVSAGVSRDSLCGIECAPGKKSGTELLPCQIAPLGSNPNDYNLGVFQFATVGAAVNHSIGKLYVHYRIRLIKPTIVSGTVYNSVRPLNTAYSEWSVPQDLSDQGVSFDVGSQDGNNLLGSNKSWAYVSDVITDVENNGYTNAVIGTLTTGNSYSGYIRETLSLSGFNSGCTCIAFPTNGLKGLLGQYIQITFNAAVKSNSLVVAAGGAIQTTESVLRVNVINSSGSLVLGHTSTGVETYVNTELNLNQITTLAATTIIVPDGLRQQYTFRVLVEQITSPLIVLMQSNNISGTIGCSMQINSLSSVTKDYLM